MKLPAESNYPTEIHIGEETYKVLFVSRFKTKGVVGECCPAERVIRIKRGQTKAQVFRTFVHEVIHAIEFEYEINVAHKVVYQFERAIVDTLLFNF